MLVRRVPHDVAAVVEVAPPEHHRAPIVQVVQKRVHPQVDVVVAPHQVRQLAPDR